MKDKVQVEVENYRELRNEASEISNKLTKLHQKEMACKKGCSECCMHFSVLPVEYFSILEELKANPPKEYQELNEEADDCNFLVNDLCQIYESRPFICRTHGLPLLFMSSEDDNWELSTCPLNFTNFDDFHSENTYSQDTYNSKLFLINQKFVKNYEVEKFGDFDMISMNRLAMDLKK
ncbi:YkgJ family cysteine cluster protein [Labilibaculum sp.]|uniref:YkgJ family cysteine cluster protein n=1 Tax=Labilibaculum sp. TaxID=2060723 RepID=UPI00356976AD